MAIIGITPTFMSPIAYRNFAPELEQQTKSNAAGLRQLADFATKAYDYNKNRQIGDALKRGNIDKAAELESQKINQQDPAVLWRRPADRHTHIPWCVPAWWPADLGIQPVQGTP